MDKHDKKNVSREILTLKTGTTVYRFFSLFLLFFSLMFFIGSIIDIDLGVLISSSILSFLLLMFSIFTEKIVYALRLPSNHLIVTKDEIVHKKRKEQVVFKLNEVSYKFHPFYEDFMSVSLLAINTKKDQYLISMTKKQFKQIKQFLEEKNSN